MSWRVAMLLTLILGFHGGAWAKKKPPVENPPLDPGVHVSQFKWGDRVEIVVPGELLSYALPIAAAGRRNVFVLVRPAPAGGEAQREAEAGEAADDVFVPPPCAHGPSAVAPRLYRVRDADPGALELVDGDLPVDAAGLESIDLDGDGAEELLLFRKESIERIDGVLAGEVVGSPVRRRIVETQTFDPGALHPRLAERRAGLPRRRLHLVSPGRLDYYASGEDGAWGLQASLPLPTEAAHVDTGFVQWSLRPQVVGSAPGGGPLLASSPIAHGNRRLEVLRLEPEAADGSRVVRCWCRLPGPEAVLSRHPMLLDGRAALLATTRRADKLSLFGERRIRIWYLEPDRSESGLDPFFAAESRINLWQDPYPVLSDVDGDGDKDLVLGYWKGLIKARVVLDVYRRRDDGTFDPAPSNTALDVKEGDKSFLRYGHDLSGDGRADLLVGTADSLLVFPGRTSRNAERLVAKNPAFELPLGDSGSSAPRLVDLDGDGRAEILIARRDGRSAGLQIFSLR